MAYAIYAPQNVNKVESAIREELARLLKDGFTEEEVAAAKKGWLQSRVVTRSEDRELMGQLSSFTYEDRRMARAAELGAYGAGADSRADCGRRCGGTWNLVAVGFQGRRLR